MAAKITNTFFSFFISLSCSCHSTNHGAGNDSTGSILWNWFSLESATKLFQLKSDSSTSQVHPDPCLHWWVDLEPRLLRAQQEAIIPWRSQLSPSSARAPQDAQGASRLGEQARESSSCLPRSSHCNQQHAPGLKICPRFPGRKPDSSGADLEPDEVVWLEAAEAAAHVRRDGQSCSKHSTEECWWAAQNSSCGCQWLWLHGCLEES